MKFIPYLNFPGNCEEAMHTYQKIFNGKIHDVSRFGDTFPVDESYKGKILHGRLTFGDNLLMFSDGMQGGTVTHGNGINLSIGLTDEEQAHDIFNSLAEGGKVTMPMARQFWGAIYGQVIDFYGVHWMINCEV